MWAILSSRLSVHIESGLNVKTNRQQAYFPTLLNPISSGHNSEQNVYLLSTYTLQGGICF